MATKGPNIPYASNQTGINFVKSNEIMPRPNRAKRGTTKAPFGHLLPPLRMKTRIYPFIYTLTARNLRVTCA